MTKKKIQFFVFGKNKSKMKVPKLVLDEEFLGEKKSAKKISNVYNLIYLLALIGLWMIIYIWLNFTDEILSTHIEIVNEWTKIIFVATLIGYFLTGLGFIKKFKVNKWVLLIGIFSLLISTYLFFGQAMIYYSYFNF